MKDIVSVSKINILCIDESKLDRSFSGSQFKINGYHFPLFRKYQDSGGVGKRVVLPEGIVAKRLSHWESLSTESFCIERNIFKRKWCELFAYRPPSFNKGEFFNKISNTFNKALKGCDNIIFADDLNIELLDPSKDISNHLSDLLDVFNLKNVIKEPTCFMSDKGSLIDIIITNKP